MKSRRVYEYIAVLKYLENEYKRPIKLTEISEIMRVKPSSAHEYIEKLVSKRYIEKVGRGKYRVSPEGEKKLLYRQWVHGVIETYLHEILGVDIETACEIASKIDYIMPLDVVEKLCSFLGHPTKCPHNQDIPHRGEKIPDTRYMSCFISNILNKENKKKRSHESSKRSSRI